MVYAEVGGQDAYKAISGTKTKGLEAEISGEIMTGWQLLAGYTYAQPPGQDGKRINSLTRSNCSNWPPAIN